MDREAWRTEVHGVTISWTQPRAWTECHLGSPKPNPNKKGKRLEFLFVCLFVCLFPKKTWSSSTVIQAYSVHSIYVGLSVSSHGLWGQGKPMWTWTSRCLPCLLISCSISQPCLTLCDPMDCSPPISFVHWIFQARARTLEGVAISSSGGLLTQVSNTTLLLWQGDSLPLNYLECPPTVPWIMKAFTSNQKSLVSHWHLCIADLLVILQMKKSQILHSSWWINNYELIIINGTTSFTNIYKLISYRVNIWSQNFLTSNHQKKCKRVKREA